MENNTLDDLEDNEKETVLGFSPEFDAFPIVLAVCIAIFNSLVLFLATRVRSLRTVTNLILGSLAFSDLLVVYWEYLSTWLAQQFKIR